MADVEMKNFGSPDDKTAFEKGKVDVVKFSNGSVGRMELQPGWRWSEHIKPMAKTEWCQATHTGYCLSGRMHVKMSDGQEFEMGPGDIGTLPPGHDAWVVGNEPYVAIDWTGMADFGRPH